MIKSEQTTTLSLRVIKDGKSGVSATNDPLPSEIKRIAKEAVELSFYNEKSDIILPQRAKEFSNPQLFDKDLTNVSEDDFIDEGKEIISLIKEDEPKMIVNYLGFSNACGESCFANSNGVVSYEKHSLASFSVEISEVSEGDFFQLFSQQTSRKNDIPHRAMVIDLLKKVKWGRKVIKIDSGKYPVIFVPQSAAVLMDYVVSAASGRFVNEKTSKFTGKLGERILDRRFTLIDDPTTDWGDLSYHLDDEGVAGFKKYLVKNGVVETFYYDLKQAAIAGTDSSGNGERGSFVQANPAVSNINIAGGDKPYAKLLKTIKRGLLVYFLLGVGENNPFNGDFQLGVNLGYLVENGEIAGRIKNVALAGNAFDLLRNNLMWLSSETERWGSFTSPYICVDNVVVTSK